MNERPPVGWRHKSILVIVFLFIVAILYVIIASWTDPQGKASGSYTSTVSWYGPGLFGNRLGCGGTLTTHTFGVAHKTLPCGTTIRICMRRCSYARVIDRGPFVYGRDLDLTGPLAYRVGLLPTRSVGIARWWVVK